MPVEDLRQQVMKKQDEPIRDKSTQCETDEKPCCGCCEPEKKKDNEKERRIADSTPDRRMMVWG